MWTQVMIVGAVVVLVPEAFMVVLFGRLRQLARRKGQTPQQWKLYEQAVAAHHRNGHEMTYDEQSEAVLNVREPSIPKVSQLLLSQAVRTYKTDVDSPATAGDLGYMHSEVFRLVKIPHYPLPSRTLCAVVCIPDGVVITRDDDQEFHFKDDPDPTGWWEATKRGFRAWRTVLSTGIGIMSGPDLEELIGQLQRAEPVAAE